MHLFSILLSQYSYQFSRMIRDRISSVGARNTEIIVSVLPSSSLKFSNTFFGRETLFTLAAFCMTASASSTLFLLSSHRADSGMNLTIGCVYFVKHIVDIDCGGMSVSIVRIRLTGQFRFVTFSFNWDWCLWQKTVEYVNLAAEDLR